MKTRDQPQAGDDPAKTVQLDDTYRVFVMGNIDPAPEGVVAPSPSVDNFSPDDRPGQAQVALDSALAEFRTAAAAVIDRIKAGNSLPKTELDREWRARLQLIDARKRVERLGRSRPVIAPQKRSG